MFLRLMNIKLSSDQFKLFYNDFLYYFNSFKKSSNLNTNSSNVIHLLVNAHNNFYSNNQTSFLEYDNHFQKSCVYFFSNLRVNFIFDKCSEISKVLQYKFQKSKAVKHSSSTAFKIYFDELYKIYLKSIMNSQFKNIDEVLSEFIIEINNEIDKMNIQYEKLGFKENERIFDLRYEIFNKNIKKSSV